MAAEAATRRLALLDVSDRGTVTSFQPPKPFVEPTGRQTRVRLGDEIVVQSDRAQLLVQYGSNGLPTYYVPRMDVIDGALVDEEHKAARTELSRAPGSSQLVPSRRGGGGCD